MRHLLLHTLYWGNGSQGPITDAMHSVTSTIGNVPSVGRHMADSIWNGVASHFHNAPSWLKTFRHLEMPGSK